MTRKVRPSEPTLGRIEDSGAALPRIEPERVAEGLGADGCAERLAEAVGPITLFAVREELVNRLRSSGGRPALSGTTRRAKVPLADEEWLQLEELAAAVAAPGFAPSAGQVASVLLKLAVRSASSHIPERPERRRAPGGRRPRG